MRVTTKMLFDQASSSMVSVQDDILAAQERVSSGKKILRPSDDPAGVNKVLSYRTMESNIDQYGRNINGVKGRLEPAESALGSASNVIQRLRELAVAQANAVNTAEDRKIGALEAGQLFDEMVGIANTKTDNGYLFAGYATNTQPFQADGSITVGANISGIINVQIDSGMTVQTNVPGDKVFKGAGGGLDVLTAINSFVTALNSNDTAGIQTAIGNMDTALGQVVSARADVGTRLSRMDGVKERLNEVKLAVTKARSNEEDIDIVKAISDFAARQNALEAARSSAGKIFNMPMLIDFLR